MRIPILPIALCAMLPIASAAIAENFDICLQTPGGLTSCNYQTMAQCERAKQAADSCVPKSAAIAPKETVNPPAGGAPGNGRTPPR